MNVNVTTPDGHNVMMADMKSHVINYDDAYYDEYYAEYYANFSADYTPREHLPLDEVIPVATLYSVIGLLGLVGNLLVIFAIARLPRMRSITNLFLLSLASADLLLVCVCVPVKGVAFYSYSWKMGEFLCKFVHYIQAVSIICSASTLTVMSIERFVAIRHPLKARSVCTIQHARFVIVAVWTFSFVAAIPMVFAIEFRTVGLHRVAHWCHKYYQEKPLFGKIYELYMLTVVLLVPVSVMVVTYTWIANIIWHVATRRADMRSGSCVSNASGDKVGSTEPQVKPIFMSPMSGQSTKAYMDDDRTRKQVVVMLMVVVLLFVICWTPILVNNLLVAFGILDYLHMGYLKNMRIAFHIMSYANSCVNPFVYAFMSKNFRDGFKQSICACIRGDGYLRRQQTSLARSVTSTTRASTSHHGGDKLNGHRSDSIAIRRPSEMEEMEIRRLM